MATATTRTRRTYLRAEERREQLLGAAAELVEKRGWEALGMVPMAEAAEFFVETAHGAIAALARIIHEGP